MAREAGAGRGPGPRAAREAGDARAPRPEPPAPPRPALPAAGPAHQARSGPNGHAASAATKPYLQVKHLNRQRHLPPPAPRRRSLPGRRVRQFRVRAWGGVLSLLKGPPRSQAGAQRPGRGDRMSRARRVLCRACLALAAVLAVLLLLPLPLPLPLPRAPAPDPDRVPTRSLTLEGDRLQPDDVFIAVKTTRKNHGPRLRLLLRTWISRAPRQVRVPSPAAQGPGFQAGAPGPRALHRLPDPLTAFSPTDVHFHRWRRP